MFEQISARSEIYKASLDALSARQRVTAQNLANADTPSYRAREVRFEATLQRKIQKQTAEVSFQPSYTHSEHLPLGLPADQPYALQVMRGSMKNDGNGVDLEHEMTQMAQAQLTYTSVSQILNGAYSQLKFVIAEGGR